MAGDAGLVAKAIETLFSWFVSEDGFKEVQKRRALAAKKKECLNALHARRWDELRRCTDEYERLSQRT